MVKKNFTIEELIINYARKKNEGDTPIIFFLSWEDGKVANQGYIIELCKDGTGIAQLFDWFMGEKSDTLVFTKAYLDTCTFYMTDMAMRSAISHAKSEGRAW